MNSLATQTAEWYSKMLMPLESNIKIAIINKLSASILEKNKTPKQALSFFDGLNNSWCDDVLPEEEASAIRAARIQGTTRTLEDF